VFSQPPFLAYDVFKFRRFRFNLIRFLHLPLDIKEKDLRLAILQCSVNVLADYVARARRAVAESGGPVEVTFRPAAHSINGAMDRGNVPADRGNVPADRSNGAADRRIERELKQVAAG
jgi:hypothetical protein